MLSLLILLFVKTHGTDITLTKKVRYKDQEKEK